MNRLFGEKGVGGMKWLALTALPLALLGQADCNDDPDSDGDDWTVGDGDCNDEDASVYPGAEELCDGLDQNCDGQVDETCSLVYRFSAVPNCGSYCYYDELHNIAINGEGQSDNNNGYDQLATGQLLDGVRGSDAWPDDLGNGNAYEWVGWYAPYAGNPMVLFQFGGQRVFETITIGINNWDPGDVTQPYQIDFAFSEDGVNFGTPLSFSTADGTMEQIPAGYRGDLTFDVSGQTGAYANITFYNPYWTFIDEVVF